ncbi:MAG: SUMF1/EgtB/PvdO family nonheme iron enzyme [Flavobacteriales bacterium]|nr:SUMF1/EgtB/PvdO family nonheme iron enzyme [Flavobacteriales bacterium]
MRASVILLLISSSSSIAQPSGPSEIHRMVRLNDSIFVDRFEIGVADWLEFMHDGDGTAPDPTVLKELPYAYLFAPASGEARSFRSFGVFTRFRIGVRSDSLRARSQRHKAEGYAHYPIAGISYEQALDYCAWRGDRYNEMLRAQGDTMFTVIYELPKAREMDALLTEADSTNGICPLFNYDCAPCQAQLKMGRRRAFVHPGKELTPVTGYAPDALGLYNLRGNAAELTASRGVAKGGSFMEPAGQCAQGWSQPYDKPEPWLGFRCIARVKAH